MSGDENLPRRLHVGITRRDTPQVVAERRKRPSRRARIEVVAQQQHHSRGHCRDVAEVTVAVAVSYRAQGIRRPIEVNECEVRGAIFNRFFDGTGQLFLAERADASARARKEPAGETDGLVLQRGVDGSAMDTQRDFVAHDALRRDLQVQIRCCKHEIVDLVFFPRIDTRGTGRDSEFADRGDGVPGGAGSDQGN